MAIGKKPEAKSGETKTKSVRRTIMIRTGGMRSAAAYQCTPARHWNIREKRSRRSLFPSMIRVKVISEMLGPANISRAIRRISMISMASPRKNFGHGKKNLSEAFFMLNLLAFFLHQILELTDLLYQSCGAGFSARKEFWNVIRASFRLLLFDSWETGADSYELPAFTRFSRMKLHTINSEECFQI